MPRAIANAKKPRRDGASSWWAWVELNHRPHAYQACARDCLGRSTEVINSWLLPQLLRI